jgi:hypothetical protein
MNSKNDYNLSRPVTQRKFMLARLSQHAGASTAAMLRKHTHICFVLPQAAQLAGSWPEREVLEA